MKTQPSKLQYIGVWLLAGFITNISSFLIRETLGIKLINTRDDILPIFFLGFTLTTILSIGVFIFIYNMFSTLNIKHVMPYLYVLGGLFTFLKSGVFFRIASSENVSELLGFLPILSFVVSVLCIRAYYINKPDRWY